MLAATALSIILCSTPESATSPLEAARLLESAFGFRLKPSGFVVVNTVVNSGAALPSADAPFMARLPAKTTAHPVSAFDGGSFLITPRQSRFGVEVGMKLGAHFTGTLVGEMDLWGLHPDAGPPGLMQGTVRLRLAYLEVSSRHFKVLAGQAPAIISPRYPVSVNHLSVAAFTQAGFLWNRIPQLTLTGMLPLERAPTWAGAPKLSAALSVVRPHSGDHDNPGVAIFDTPDPGVASALPFLQARAALDNTWLSLGVAGHGGVESYQLTNDAGAATRRTQVPTWMVGADARMTAYGFSATAQAFTGANLNSFFAMTGVRKTGFGAPGTLKDVEALPAAGGWMQLAGPGWPGVVEWAVGAGVERTLDVSKVPVGERFSNAAIQLSVMFPVHKHFDAGVELYRVMSTYKTASGFRDATNDNLGFALRMKL